MEIRTLFPGLILSALVSISSSAENIDYSSENWVMQFFPYPEAATNYKAHKQSRINAMPRLQPKLVPCPGQDLTPATPGQYTKDYHADVIFRYNHFKVPGDKRSSRPANNPQIADLPGINTFGQRVCNIASERSSARNPDGSMFCAVGKFGRYVVKSDIFYVHCGSEPYFFRGYWQSAYVMDNFNVKDPTKTSLEEHAGTNSEGRGDSIRPHPEFKGAMEDIPGGTYKVPRSRFLFFTKAMQKDILSMDKALGMVAGANGTYVRCQNGTFAVRASGGCK
jgi:hypothetical protein